MYAKIFASMWDGTLGQHWEGWAVFVFMLANCDREGYIDMTHEAIARRSGLPIEVVRRGIEVLEAPDVRSRSAEEDGRRIVRTDPERSDRDWGWHIVNLGHYRGLRDQETVRAQTKERVAKFREKKRAAEAQGSLIDCNAVTHAVTPGKRHAEADADAEVTEQKEEAGSEVPLVTLPTVRAGRDYPVFAADVEEWKASFPAVDVLQELREMRAWSLANKVQRKTFEGMPRFIVRWLGKEQDRGGTAARASPMRRGHRAGADQRYLDSNPNAFNAGGEGDG